MACKTLVFAVLVLAVVFYATSAQADLPGVVATQTVESLHYSAKQAMALARAEWGKQPLPGTQGNITEPIMGTLSYAINNITLAPNPTLPDPVVSLNPTLGYQFFISGVSFGLTADFNYSAPTWKMSGTGLADIVITNLTMSFNVLVKAVNGKFNFSVSDCTALISDVKVVVSGGAAWMQPWMSVLKSTIISEIEAEIVNVTVTYVEQMNTFLQMAPTRLPIMNMVIVDMTLTQDPVFTSSDVSVFVKGEIVPINDPTAEAPFSPAPMPRKVTGQMLEVMVSDYVFNTAGLALFKGGFLQYNVTDQLLPSWSPIRLNTSTWTFLLPELASKYPNMAMVATVAATQGPKITFAPKVGINAVAQGGIFFYVLPPGDLPAIPVFTLGLNLTTSLLVSIVNDSKIAGQLGSLTPSVSLQWSSVGDIPVSLLSSGIQMLVSALVPVANEALAQGYPLPSTPGLKLVNATIGYGPDYMYVSSSVNYQPPTVLAATTSMANLRRPATPITIN